MNDTVNTPAPIPPAPLTEEQVKKIINDQITATLAASEKVIVVKTIDPAQKPPEPKTEAPKKGMTINGYLEFIRFYSSQASSINRSLALAGVAIIWLFKKPHDTDPIISGLLNFPLFCLVVSLALDLLQYILGYLAWLIFYEYNMHQLKKEGKEEAFAKDIEAPDYISLPIDIIFITKIYFMLLAYWNIFKFLHAMV